MRCALPATALPAAPPLGVAAGSHGASLPVRPPGRHRGGPRWRPRPPAQGAVGRRHMDAAGPPRSWCQAIPSRAGIRGGQKQVRAIRVTHWPLLLKYSCAVTAQSPPEAGSMETEEKSPNRKLDDVDEPVTRVRSVPISLGTPWPGSTPLMVSDVG